MEYIYLGIVLLLLAFCIFLAVTKIKQDKSISKLTNGINGFIQNGNKTDFSVKDNNFSRLQNSVSDLENLITLEKKITLLTKRKRILNSFPTYHTSLKHL